MTGPEQVLVEDWCQQYPSHSIGQPRVRRRRRALRRAAATARASTSPTTGQDGSPLNPCGDPPGGVGGDADAADGRGRRAAQPGPADDRRPGRRSTARSSASTRPPAQALPDNPLVGERRPERAPDRRLRPAQPVPLRDPARARTSSGSATSAGTTGRRSTASPTRPARRRELRLALLRGRRPPGAATTAPT